MARKILLEEYRGYRIVRDAYLSRLAWRVEPSVSFGSVCLSRAEARGRIDEHLSCMARDLIEAASPPQRVFFVGKWWVARRASRRVGDAA